MNNHLVILRPAWLERLIDGRKSVEFRASNRRIAPWGKVSPGDRLWLKLSGGPVQATAIVEAVEMRGPFAPNELAEFLDGLEGHPDDALDDEWRSRLTTQKYVTLVWTDSLRKIPDLDISDLRRGRQDSWQVLPDSHVETVYSRLKSGWVDVVTND